MTGAELLVIPLVALAIPILLVVAALLFDALYLSWIAYSWYEQGHPHHWHLPHRWLS